jgi:hypothetical protein
MNVSAHHIVPTRILFPAAVVGNLLTLFRLHGDRRNLRRADSSTLLDFVCRLSGNF